MENNVEKKLVASMEEMAEALESGDRRRLTVREVKLPVKCDRKDRKGTKIVKKN